MIRDEDKYATKNELMFYFIMLIILVTYGNHVRDNNDVKIWKNHNKNKKEIWAAQIQVDSINAYKWNRQFEVDSTIVHYIKKNHKK